LSPHGQDGESTPKEVITVKAHRQYPLYKKGMIVKTKSTVVFYSYFEIKRIEGHDLVAKPISISKGFHIIDIVINVKDYQVGKVLDDLDIFQLKLESLSSL